jgi:hypothetical protein
MTAFVLFAVLAALLTVVYLPRLRERFRQLPPDVRSVEEHQRMLARLPRREGHR